MDQEIPQILKPSEVMELLKISKATFFRYIRSKTKPLPHRKLDTRTIRIIREELFEWMKVN